MKYILLIFYRLEYSIEVFLGCFMLLELVVHYWQYVVYNSCGTISSLSTGLVVYGFRSMVPYWQLWMYYRFRTIDSLLGVQAFYSFGTNSYLLTGLVVL